MTKRKITIAVGLGIVLTAGAVWALMGGPDPKVEQVKQMQADLFKQGTRPDPAKLAELRKAEEQLTPAQRQEVGRDRGERFQQRMAQTVADYFALPAGKRGTTFLTSESKRWRNGEKPGKQIVLKRADPARPAGAAVDPAAVDLVAAGLVAVDPAAVDQVDRAAEDRVARVTPMRRMARGLQRLDGTSATQRAQFQTFMADMNKRRLDQGLPPMGRRPLPPR